MTDPVRGCLPFIRVLPNTQSSGLEYGVCCFQFRMTSASRSLIGTGLPLVLVLGFPICPSIQVRLIRILWFRKSTSCHCKPRHSLIRSPVAAAKIVSVRSNGGKPFTRIQACSGFRTTASYSLHVSQVTQCNGLVPWSRAMSSCFWRDCRFGSSMLGFWPE